MLSGGGSTEGRFSVVEASLYPHDSSRVAKLLASAIIGSLSGTLYIGFTGNLHKHVFCRKFYQREFQRGRWRAVARVGMLRLRRIFLRSILLRSA
jgi:hypothetical protein